MRGPDHDQSNGPEQHGPLTQAHVVDPRHPRFTVEGNFLAAPHESTNSTNQAPVGEVSAPACARGAVARWTSRPDKPVPRSFSAVRNRSMYKATSSGRVARPAMK